MAEYSDAQTPNALIAELAPERAIFAPGIVSLPDRHEFGSVLTRTGDELFIGIEHGQWASIVSYKREGDTWVGPVAVIGSSELSANDPMLSPDESSLYFISRREGQYDIGYVKRLDNGGWSPARWLPAPINSAANEYYISFTRGGDLVFATDRNAQRGNDFDVVRGHKSPTGDYTLETFPETINTPGYEADAFIDSDGQFLIFSSSRYDGFGRGDLYVSFSDENGGWSEAVLLGASVNTSGHELCPFVSADGKWLYYTSEGDIYRISTDVISQAKVRSESLSSEKATKSVIEPTENIVAVEPGTVLLTNATLHIGDGTDAKLQHSVLMEGATITRVGPDGSFDYPDSARVIDVDGASVLPGFIGMHNHTHMPGQPLLKHMAPRLYLAGGVTTMTTAGSADTLGELAMAASIRSGDVPGPTIYPSAHYITGPGGNEPMTKPSTPKDAKQFVRTWAKRGVSWFKLYRHTEPEIAAAVIDEAHLLGLKVTGHLCSITFEEAAAMGIDSLEHGLNAATDFVLDKPTGECVPSRASKTGLIPDSPELGALVQTLVANDVTLTSTPAILETGFPHRPPADLRSLALMSESDRKRYDARQTRLAKSAETTTSTPAFWNLLLAFERQFVAAGGHLVAGPDTGRHVYPGYGDQRNYELLVEAGFGVDGTIQIMTSNGAKTLGIENETGFVKPGYEADLLVLSGNLLEGAASIKNPKIVFKDGVGYDPQALIRSVEKQISANR